MIRAYETVVLLHGIARTGRSMRGLESVLREVGYRTLNISYPSRRDNLAGLAVFLDRKLTDAGVWATSSRVHFVTHSMGGLVAARYLADFRTSIPAEKVGRVVMLAPPNGGSEVADFLERFPPYAAVYGPAGQELTTAARSAVDIRPYYEVGVVAGTTGWPYILGSALIQSPHDGRVAVEHTKIDGMMDHLVVAATHSFIMQKPEVQRQVVHFLGHGEFRRAAARAL